MSGVLSSGMKYTAAGATAYSANAIANSTPGVPLHVRQTHIHVEH